MNKIQKILVLALLFFLSINIQKAFAGDKYYDKISFTHTAYTLEKGEYQVGIEILKNGGLLAFTNVGLFYRFDLGVSYGGDNFIGSDDIEFYDEPGVQLKLKILEEQGVFPAFTIGFDSQKKEGLMKAPWIYGTVTKNVYFAFGSSMDLHAQVNYNSQENDDKSLNLAFGSMIKFVDEFYLGAEYNFAFDDQTGIDKDAEDKGFLDLSARLKIFPKLEIDFLLSDLLGKKEEMLRELKIIYSASFLE